MAVRTRAHTLQVSSQDGVSLSCDLTQALCSFTLDGWLHGQRKKKHPPKSVLPSSSLNMFLFWCTGASVGLLGTNDNEAGNDSPLPDGSQAQSLDSFLTGWQLGQVTI